MLTKNLVHLFVRVKSKDTTKKKKKKDTTNPKIERRKDLLLAASKNTGDVSQSGVSWNSKIGEVVS